MKTLILFASILLSFLSLFGCSMITMNTPFADIDKLGTLVGPEDSIAITNDLGIVVVEYEDSLKRRIVWNGESRTIKLHKSLYKNGVFNSYAKVDPPFTGGIYGVEYYEATPYIENEKDLESTLLYRRKLGYQHRKSESIVVRFKVRGMDNRKFIFIGMEKLKVGAATPNMWNN